MEHVQVKYQQTEKNVRMAFEFYLIILHLLEGKNEPPKRVRHRFTDNSYEIYTEGLSTVTNKKVSF